MPDRRPAYERAVALWEAGDYERCLHALDDCSASEGQMHRHYQPGAILLRGRALIRAGRIEDARDWLSSNALQFQDVRGDSNATYAMLVGMVYASLRSYGEAEAWFSRARRCEPHAGIVAEIDYSRALALYQQGDLRGARAEIDRALPMAPDILRARTRALRGWVSIAESQPFSAQRDFSTALQLMRNTAACDAHLQVSTLYALTILAAELQLGDLELLESEVGRVCWTTNLAGEHTQILRHLGLAYRHAGDRDRALAKFVASTEAAPGTPWSIFGFVECANVSLSRGEECGPLALAKKAASLADRHDWDEFAGEKRLALLMLAQLLARLNDGERAQMYRDLYYKKPGVSSMSALAYDTRLITFERHVEGCVLGAIGSIENASAILTEVRTEWSRIGYRFRALEATDDLERFSLVVEGPAGAPIRPKLSVRDEQMLTYIVEGKTNAEIAEQFHIAQNTVKNNVLQLYAKFGVHNRTQLVVAARRAGSGRREV